MGNLTEYRNIFNLQQHIAIVTGGCGHLGKEFVRALHAFDANVIVAGRSAEKYEATFSKEEKECLHFKHIDITSSNSINQLFSEIKKEFGRVDILVNNAQASRGNSQENMSDKDWNFTMEGVLGSVHKTIRAVMPIMKEQNEGKIINISSMYGIVSPDFRLYEGEKYEAFTNPPHYGAAKAAMIQLTKYYAALLGKYNIQINAISPGPFPDKRIHDENKTFIKRLKNKNPLNKIGEPIDLVGGILLLGSKASNFITGQTIQIDGGWTIW